MVLALSTMAVGLVLVSIPPIHYAMTRRHLLNEMNYWYVIVGLFVFSIGGFLWIAYLIAVGSY